MESNNSAVLNVVSQPKDVAILSKEHSKDLDHSSLVSEATFDNDSSLVCYFYKGVNYSEPT